MPQLAQYSAVEHGWIFRCHRREVLDDTLLAARLVVYGFVGWVFSGCENTMHWQILVQLSLTRLEVNASEN